MPIIHLFKFINNLSCLVNCLPNHLDLCDGSNWVKSHGGPFKKILKGDWTHFISFKFNADQSYFLLPVEPVSLRVCTNVRGDIRHTSLTSGKRRCAAVLEKTVGRKVKASL